MWRKGNPLAQVLVGMQIGAATVQNNVEVPQKVKNRATVTVQQSHYWVFTQRIEKH